MSVWFEANFKICEDIIEFFFNWKKRVYIYRLQTKNHGTHILVKVGILLLYNYS